MRTVLADALTAHGRGSQSRLADALGVRVQTVNKWVKGGNAPDMERWPAIEQHLGLDPGTLAAAAGITQPPPADDIARLQREIDELRGRLDAVTRQLAAQAIEPDPPTPGSGPASGQRSRRGSRRQEGVTPP